MNYVDKYVLIRGDRSGISVGKLVSRTDRTVVLNECIRLWYWSGANSILQLASEGVKRPNECKFSVQTNNHSILDVIEIIPLSDDAKISIYGVKAWRI